MSTTTADIPKLVIDTLDSFGPAVEVKPEATLEEVRAAAAAANAGFVDVLPEGFSTQVHCRRYLILPTTPCQL